MGPLRDRNRGNDYLGGDGGGPKDCMLMFGCSPAEEVITKRKDKFLAKYTAMDNVIIGAFLS